MKSSLLLVVFFIGFFCNAQQQELLDNTWYLEKIVFEGDEFLTPHNEEVTQVPFFHFETIGDSYSFKTTVCQEIRTGGLITDSHLLFDTSAYDSQCEIQANTDFQFLYFDNFLHAGILNTFEYPYEIVEESGYLRLIINPNANITAYYNNQILSSLDENSNGSQIQFTFQKGQLIIQAASTKPRSVSIYDLSGKLVQAFEVSSSQTLNTTGLRNGIYIVKITDEKGNVYSKKLRKE